MPVTAHRKIPMLLLAAALACAPAALGGCSSAQSDVDAEAAAATAAAEGDAVSAEYGISIDRCEIIAASESMGTSDEPTVAITFTFTNTYTSAMPFAASIFPTASQNGTPLSTSALYAGTEETEVASEYEEVAPGETVTIQKCYVLTGDADIVVACDAIDRQTMARKEVASRTFSIAKNYAAYMS